MSARRRLALFTLSAVLLLAGCAAAPEAEKAEGAAVQDLEVFFFSAGSADAILLTTEDSAVLIDTGEKGFGKTVLARLEEKGVDRIDCLIVTHFDKDHVGGAAKILNGVEVGTVLQSNQPKDSGEYENYVQALEKAGIEPVTVRETYAFTLDGVSYTVDPPRQAEYAEDSSNNSSLIVTVRNGDDTFLFAGDAQTQRLAEFLDTGPGSCDVLKVPHHGRDEPMLDELISSTEPSFAVITSSEEEPESEAVVEELERAGVRVLLTRERAVTVRSSGDGVTVE